MSPDPGPSSGEETMVISGSKQVNVQHVSPLCESSPEDGIVGKKRGWHCLRRLSSRAKGSQLSLLALREAETQEVKREKLLVCFLHKCS